MRKRLSSADYWDIYVHGKPISFLLHMHDADDHLSITKLQGLPFTLKNR
jgi:hypothetical protein